jgi:hypothetical protein
MKHAGDAALDQVEELLTQIRKYAGMKEKKRGVFYRDASAFLHFHEDPAGLFADLRTNAGWERIPVQTRVQKRDLLAKIKTALTTNR